MQKPSKEQLEEAGVVLSQMYIGRIVGLLGMKLRPGLGRGISTEELYAVREVALAARWDWRLGRYIGYEGIRMDFKKVQERVPPLLDLTDQYMLIWHVAIVVAVCAIDACEAADEHREGKIDDTTLHSRVYHLVETAQNAVEQLPDGRLKDASWDCFDMVKEGMNLLGQRPRYQEGPPRGPSK
jgi:hypothetical protein